MIGTKTVATLGLLAGGVALASWLGVFSLERIAARGPGALFLIGCFAAVVGTLMFRFWHLAERSRHYFRWARDATLWETEAQFLGAGSWRITIGENRTSDAALDLGPRMQRAICVAIALLLALSSIGSRALDLLGRFQRGFSSANSSYCPEPEAAVDTAMDPNVPGCELVRRAYALGYAQSLGDCAAKTRTQTTAGPCTLRQRDEPLAHFSWRRLDTFWTNLRQHTGASYSQKLWRDFVERFHRIEPLRKAEQQVLWSAPHASHHIFTNLPDPKDGAFRAETCADRYRWLAHRPAPGEKTRASKVFEHVVAQLLFESRYEPAAGYCREYQVHWGVPPDACQRLAKNPEATLAEVGAGKSVGETLERYGLGKQLESLAARQRPLEPSSIVSFQCYIEGDGPERKSTPFMLDGIRFEAEEIHVPTSKEGSVLYADRYDAVAKLLVRGFHYGALLSQAGLEQMPSGGAEASLARHDYLLTRLYGLEGFDIYLEPGWIADRPDLLEVYPYQIHLKNYVQMFRRQYRLERGRL